MFSLGADSKTTLPRLLGLVRRLTSSLVLEKTALPDHVLHISGSLGTGAGQGGGWEGGCFGPRFQPLNGGGGGEEIGPIRDQIPSGAEHP